MDADDYARSRIEKLLRMAREMLEEDALLSRRYVELARKIAMRHRLKLGSKLFCKKCNTIFIVGKTFKTRVSKGAPIQVCLTCGAAKQVASERKPVVGGRRRR